MKIKAIALALAITSAFVVGCSGDDPEPVTTADTGTGTTDTGMPGTDTGTEPTDTGTPGDTGGDTPTPLPTGQIDRMGRPAINTALVGTDALKDTYNKTGTYIAAQPMDIVKSFNDSLIFVDKLDGKDDWTLASGTHPLRDALLGDFLVVDTGKTCPDKGSYLDVELFVLGLRATANTTCGGRTLNDDVMDTTLTALVTALKGPVSDGVSAATKPAVTTFPYLAAPN